jgi:putative transposase
MKINRHTPEQIITKLREAEALLAQGATIPQVCKQQAITEQTYYRWRSKYGNMKTDEARRLKDLEVENQRLKKLVADQALDIQMLKEITRGKF